MFKKGKKTEEDLLREWDTRAKFVIIIESFFPSARASVQSVLRAVLAEHCRCILKYSLCTGILWLITGVGLFVYSLEDDY